MYYIMNSEGRLFAGFTGNCFIWKTHHTRAACYGNYTVALKEIEYYAQYEDSMFDCVVVNEDDIVNSIVGNPNV